MSVIFIGLFPLLGACSDDNDGTGPTPPPPPPDTVPVVPGSGDIRLNSTVTYQTITGWEAHSQSGHYHEQFDLYKNTLFNQAVNELGITRLRLEPRSSLENSQDIEALYLSGAIDGPTYLCNRFATVNDNADPFTINWSGFKFSSFDNMIESVIIPMRQRMAARGESLYLVATYTAFTRSNCNGAQYHHDDSPEEYAEFVLAVHLHMQQKYGFIPDAWEVILEPDNTDFWRGRQIGEAIVAAANRLQQHGITQRFIAPSNTNMANAIAYFDDMIQVPGVRQHLSEFSYHRYGGVSDANLRAIGDRAVQYGVNTSMLEHIGSGHEDLHKDIKLGRVSAWQQFTLAWYEGGDNGGKYFIIQPGSSTATIAMGSRSRYLRQYFLYARPGATRIEAQTSKPELDPLAFINTGGKYAVVVKASGASSFTVEGLPAGTYGIRFTTATQWHQSAPDVTLAAGRLLSASIPAQGVLTIFRK